MRASGHGPLGALGAHILGLELNPQAFFLMFWIFWGHDSLIICMILAPLALRSMGIKVSLTGTLGCKPASSPPGHGTYAWIRDICG